VAGLGPLPLPSIESDLMEEIVKKNLILLVLVSGALMTCAHAEAKQNYQSATVVSVEKHESPSNYVGGNPSDAPLQATVHSYDIGIRLNCETYVARYESALDYLPSAFTPNHDIEVNLQKHVIHVSLPGNRDVRMSINRRIREKNSSCMARN
jgi:hypothetical protein